MKKHLQDKYIFSIDTFTEILPVDGEVFYKEPGLSHGFVSFMHPETGKKLGFCGIDYFDDNAVFIREI